MIYTHVLNVLRAGASAGNDAYGNAVPGAEVAGPDIPAEVDGDRSSELLAGRDTAVEYVIARTPIDADVRYSDRVRWQGRTYTVDGIPVQRGPGHRLARLEIVLKRVSDA